MNEEKMEEEEAEGLRYVRKSFLSYFWLRFMLKIFILELQKCFWYNQILNRNIFFVLQIEFILDNVMIMILFNVKCNDDQIVKLT